MKVFIVGAVAVLCFTPAYSSIIPENGQQYVNPNGLVKDKLEAVQQYQPNNGWEIVSHLINCVNERLQFLEEVFNQFKTVFPMEFGKTYLDYNNQGPIAGRATATGTGAAGGTGGGGVNFESNFNGVYARQVNFDHNSIPNNLLDGSPNELQRRSGVVGAGIVNGRSYGQTDEKKKEEKLNHEITKLLTAELIASSMKEKFEEEKAKEEEEQRRIELQRELVAVELLAEAANEGGSGHKSNNLKSGLEQSNINVANHNIGHQFSSSHSNSAKVQQEKAELEKLQQLQNLLAISNAGQDVNVNTAGFNSGQTSQATCNTVGNVYSNDKVTLENFKNQLQSQPAKTNGVGGNVNVGQTNSEANSLSSNKLDFGDFNHNPNLKMTFLNELEQSTDNQGGNRDDDDLLGQEDVKHVEKEASTAQLIAQIMEDMNGQRSVQGRSRSEKQEDINNLIISQEINDIRNRIQDQLTEDSKGFDGQSLADRNQNMISVVGTAYSLSNVGNHHSRQLFDGGFDGSHFDPPNNGQTFRFQGRSYGNSPATYPGVTPYMAYSSGYDQYAPVQPAYQNVYGGYPAGVAYGPVYPANPGYQQRAYY